MIEDVGSSDATTEPGGPRRADRRARRRQETIEEILDIAIDVMSEHGVNGLTLAEVARRLGVQPPSIYKYFPSIGAVYDALFKRAASENLAVLREIGRLRELRLPLLVGTSRKSTIGKVLGGLSVEERGAGTAATVAIAIAFGADAVRVHDVREMARVSRMADAIVRG